MKWKDFVYQQIIEHCNSTGSRTFSLQEFLDARLNILQSFRPYKDVKAKIRQQLQFLRDDNLISFLDNKCVAISLRVFGSASFACKSGKA
ncbi:MAG: hypothetical protein QX189_13050 [Methylococcales bacterium]